MSTATTQPEPLQLAEWLDFWSQPTAKKAAAALRRLHAENEQLRLDLEAVGAGGVGPLIPTTAQHQGESSGDNDLQRENGHLITSSSTVPAGWRLVPVEPTEKMVDMGRGLSSFPDGVYRAMLDAAPQPQVEQEPAYLLRDLADDIGVKALDLIAAIRAAGLGDYSVNMMLPAKVCVAMCQRFAAAPQPPEHYDQQALDLCLTCGWKTLIPGDCCLICARQKPQVEQEPVAVIGDVWTLNWVGSGPIYQIVKKHGLKIGDKLYTHQQNLRCKSNQARLATLWGYVKADQPQVEQEPVASLADAIRAEPTELIRKWRVLELIKDHTRPQPKPLTVEQIDGIINDLDPIFLDTPTGFEEDFCRAVERAHGIGGEA